MSSTFVPIIPPFHTLHAHSRVASPSSAFSFPLVMLLLTPLTKCTARTATRRRCRHSRWDRLAHNSHHHRRRRHRRRRWPPGADSHHNMNQAKSTVARRCSLGEYLTAAKRLSCCRGPTRLIRRKLSCQSWAWWQLLAKLAASQPHELFLLYAL